MTPETATPRPPGRPRSTQADEAIARAAMEAVVAHGFEAMSMEGVAAQAGVSKATLYRRYASKEEMVVSIVSRLPPPGPPPDQGSIMADLMELVGGQQARTLDMGRRVVTKLIAAALTTPELRAVLFERMIAPFRAVLAELVRRGMERGELRPDLDIDTAVDLLHGSLVYRLILAGGDPNGLDADAERMLPMVVAGLRAS